MRVTEMPGRNCSVMKRRVAILVATLTGVGVALPSPAGAITPDQWGMDDGLGVVPRVVDSGAVQLGRALCGRVGTVKPRTLMAGVADFAPTLNPLQVETVVDSAVAWLCPQYLRQYLANR